MRNLDRDNHMMISLRSVIRKNISELTDKRLSHELRDDKLKCIAGWTIELIKLEAF
jgi:hypothetical protein